MSNPFHLFKALKPIDNAGQLSGTIAINTIPLREQPEAQPARAVDAQYRAARPTIEIDVYNGDNPDQDDSRTYTKVRGPQGCLGTGAYLLYGSLSDKNGKIGTSGFVSGLIGALIDSFYANKRSFIGRQPSEQDVWNDSLGNSKLVVVKFNRAFTENDFRRNEWCNYVSIQLHEIGHNIGFGHSWDGNTEYDDQSCMMGYSYSQDDTRMCFNGPKSYQAGWYNTNYNGYATFTYSQAAQENTRLIGQVDYPSVNQDIVVIKIETGTSTDYFIHFNRAKAANSGTKEGANQVLITSAGNNGLSYAKSTLLAKLSAGGTYTLSLSEGDVEVTVNSIDTSATIGYADISISTGTESPTKSPSSSPSASPTTKAPSKAPSSSPSASPTISAAPSKTPTLPPSKSPTLKPTLAPTPSPTPCDKAGIDQSCTTGSDCCSGLCTGGNPRNRVCYSNTPTTQSPVAPSPTPEEPPTPPTSCPVCGNGSTCCPEDGVCSTKGKESRRECVAP